MAIYFESPDLDSSRGGWRTIGNVNRVRLGQFRRFLPRRPEHSLPSLLGTDQRFRGAGLVTDAYAESWAFCYFLIRNHPREFARYLELLQEKLPLETDTSHQRLADFRTAFERDPGEFNVEFLRQMKRIK